MPWASSAARRRRARARATSFSNRLSERRAPESVPPCAASRTTIYCVCTCARGGRGTEGTAGCCAMTDAQSRTQLIQWIDRKATQQFREKVRGFLRHDFSGEGHFAQLRHRYRIHQEGNIGITAQHLLDRLAGIAQIAKVGLLA